MAWDVSSLGPALLLTATAALYARAGDRFAALKVQGEGRMAAVLFSTWWVGIALACALQGFVAALAAVGLSSASYSLVVLHATLLSLSIGAWGFTHYSLYVAGGRSRLSLLLSASYVLLAAALVVAVELSARGGATVSTWGAGIHFDAPSPALPYLVAAVFAPPLVGACACLVVSRRLDPTLSRYRLCGISASIVLVSLTGALAALAAPVAPPIAVLGGALSAGVLLLAYQPPRWVVKRVVRAPA